MSEIHIHVHEHRSGGRSRAGRKAAAAEHRKERRSGPTPRQRAAGRRAAAAAHRDERRRGASPKQKAAAAKGRRVLREKYGPNYMAVIRGMRK